VLSALRRSSAPYELTPGQLVRQTLVGSGTTTNRLDRLESRGLIDRRPDPEDGRVRRVRLTDRGRDRLDAALADLLDRERRLLGGLSEPDRNTLAGLLRSVLVNFESRAGAS